jgi:hypothetical protein
MSDSRNRTSWRHSDGVASTNLVGRIAAQMGAPRVTRSRRQRGCICRAAWVYGGGRKSRIRRI